MPPKHIFFLLLALFSSLQTPTSGQENTTKPVYMCYQPTFSSNSTYIENINLLFSALQFRTPPAGYANYSIGTEPDRAVGAALCRGDISSDQCSQCLQTATQFVQQFCPQKLLGVSREEKCMLYYFNRTISYDEDIQIRSETCSDDTITDMQAFQESFQPMMDGLIKHAAYVSKKMFSTAEANYSSSSKLYGLVQCTPDLSPSQCHNCLSVTLGVMTGVCWGNNGASVVALNCWMRFESYSFYSESSEELQSPPSPPPPPEESTDANFGISSSGKQTGLNSAEKILLIVIPLVSALACAMAIIVLCLWRRRRYIVSVSSVDEENKQPETRYFNLSMLRSATNNFSDENKLGEGGFGAVYKGVLADGLELAVKRLSKNSKQGLVELRNEVVFVAKLQHRNLVRLLGCCLEDKEKLLIYEFLPNLSLDKFLFGSSKREELNWPSRYKIIEGIARGLLYLHEDSRLTIIHRDLKASNILLDLKMNPKISDFGLAKLFDIDKSRGTTSHIAGTNGYMAPEYAMLGRFSTSSDVYSFGVLILEIVTGQRIMNFQGSEQSTNLLSYAWNCWNEEKALEIVDKSLGEMHYHVQEVLRCIHIGLLCVQEEASKRPNMTTVVLMMNSYSVTLQSPSVPGFFIRENATIITDANSDSGSQGNKLDNIKDGKTAYVSTNYVTITTMEPR